MSFQTKMIYTLKYNKRCLQIADDIIEEHGGRLLHQRLSIQELCEKHSTYSGVMAEHIDEFKVYNS